MALKSDIIEQKDGSHVFFTSDQHFSHANILKFCNRPFSSVEEMDQTMIEKWNNKVKPNDTVYHLGDFCWGGYHKWASYREQLNGDIILIKGNHDMRNLTSTAEGLFKHVAQQLLVEVEGQKIYLNHFPLLCYAGTYRNDEGVIWALNGHTHIGPYSKTGLDFERMKMTFPTQYDVGVDMNNFEPISFNEIKEKITYQMQNDVNMMFWIK